MRYRLRKINFLPFFQTLFVILLTFPLYGCKTHAKYESISKSLSTILSETFISYDLCIDKNDCNKKKLYFLGPEKDFLHITLWQANNPLVVADIISEVISLYEVQEAQFSFFLEVYKDEHPINLAFIFGKEDPYITLLLKGEE